MTNVRKEITIKELTAKYEDKKEEGVASYNGFLDIRPPYQREFIYNDAQRKAVINTIVNNLPLGLIYWSDKGNNKYEIIDGQQRTLSICQYINGDFSFKDKYYDNLTQDEKDKILNYKLDIYICSGTESEKLEWFKTINIAGEKLTDQELRNAVYTGPFVNEAKKHFSKTDCPAYKIGSDYISGVPNRQDYLETALKWISNGNIVDYMAKHQKDKTDSALWLYFNAVISWIPTVFKTKHKNMKLVDWGTLYNKYKDKVYDPEEIQKEVDKLILDDDVTKKSGIYAYILTRDEKHLSIRSFTESIKQKVYVKQKGICPKCNSHFNLEDMEADHITPWSKGGKTLEDNCQLLCKDDNRKKSNT